MRRSLILCILPITTLLAYVPTSPDGAFMGDQRPFNLDKINISRDFEKSAAVQLAKLRTDGQNGDLDAQAHLGVIYYLGVGVPVDWSEAQDWFRKAAERGRPDAQTKLGFMYFMGQGLPKDIQESMKWFRMAAEQGETSAQICIGAMYAQGLGVSQDVVEAYSWLLQAIGGGDAGAAEPCRAIQNHLTPHQVQEGYRRAVKAIQIREKTQIMAGD